MNTPLLHTNTYTLARDLNSTRHLNFNMGTVVHSYHLVEASYKDVNYTAHLPAIKTKSKNSTKSYIKSANAN
jgi:hypothetical protein